MMEGLRRRRLPAQCAEVWLALLGHGDVAVCAEDSQRASRLRGPDRRQLLGSHAIARQIVSAHTGEPPENGALEMPYGRPPSIRGGDMHISLSHSHDWVMVGVCGEPIGVDLETESSLAIDDLVDLAEFAMTADEFAAWRTTASSEKPRALLRAWTRKEAVLKFRGEGVSDRPLCDVRVGVAEAAYPRIVGDERPLAIALVDVEAAPGFVGAVAVPAGTGVRFRKWSAPGQRPALRLEATP